MKTLTMIIATALLTVVATTLYAAEIEGVEIHGFISQGYIKSTKQNNFPVSDSGHGSFNFNDFGINFSKQITPALRLGCS